MPTKGQTIWVAAVLPALAVAAGCGGGAQPPPARAQAAVRAGLALHANEEKYSDRGQPPAVGRAGNAQLRARALLGRDGQTVLEVTTSALDSPAPAPGWFGKIQVKATAPDGRQLWVDNRHRPGEGGAASFAWRGLSRGSGLRVQANVLGIDPRTDVATADATVLLRPDLAVVQLSAPARARRGLPVVIAATVRELNGDVGASADCVLYVDGVRADGMRSIWVDASGAVSCAFSPTFAAPGVHSLRAAVENVVPADDDPSNDSRAGSIEIVDGNDFYDEATVIADTAPMSCSYAATTTYAGGIAGTTVSAGQVVSLVQQSILTGWAPFEVAFPLADVVLGQTSGSAVLHAAAFQGQDAAPAPPGSPRCVRLDSAGAWGLVAFHVCSGTVGAAANVPSPLTTLSYTRWAGEVTYHSTAYASTFDSRSGSGAAAVYAYNTSGTSAAGLPLPALGASVDFRVLLADAAGRTFAAALTVPLSAYAYRSDQPLSCSTYPGDGFTYTQCTERHCQEQYLAGFASGIPGQ